MWQTLISLWLALSDLAARKTSSRRRPAFRRPQLEALEDRTLLSAYLVTTSDDNGDNTNPISHSLRDAINQVNADTSHALFASPSNPSVDEIDFKITAASDAAGGGTGYNATTRVATIMPLSALPSVTNGVVIDGYTQAGASQNTLLGPSALGSTDSTLHPERYGDNAVLKIVLDGTNAGNATGLYLAGNNVTVQGLVINSFANDGIILAGTGDLIQGNFLGTDVTGTQAFGNAGADVFASNASSTIGGTAPAARNIISAAVLGAPGPNGDGIFVFGGNAVVQGNFIGTDVTGTKALGNAGAGIHYNSDNTLIGCSTPAAGNVISGNGAEGILGQGGSGDVVEGNLIGTDVTGTKALPNGHGIFIQYGDGVTIGAPAAGNLISGNAGYGIRLDGSGVPNNTIQGNFIGTDVTGTMALGQSVGIFAGSNNNLIGGLDTNTPGAPLAGGGNLISGNSAGIFLFGAGNAVEGNYIGTNITGTPAVGNGYGVSLGAGGANDINNIIGGTTPAAANVIAGNQLDGVIASIAATNDAILGNSIYDNGGLGINLNGGNNNQAAPVLTAAYSGLGFTIVTGTITSTPNATFRVEFFANAAGDPEGRTLLGSSPVTTDAAGHGSFTAVLSAVLPAGQGLVTATATDPNGNTSEFSAGVIATPLPPSSLSGVVWEDFNDDGQVDFGEKGISGVTITLTGADFLGNAVNLSQLTDSDGAYVFLNLLPGNYYITETQPAGYLQGIDSVGTAGGGLAATDQFFVQLSQGVDGLNYNYGEQPSAGGSVQHGQTAGIGFWNNKKGQALILALNGGGASHELGDWLAATLPNIFGANSANNLAGQGNAAVAALFQHDFLLKGVKLDAQVLATALSVYVTNATLDPTSVAAQYGFTVSGDGVGTATVNVGSNGAAFGVANSTTLTLMDLLLATDKQAVNGLLYNGDAALRVEANDVFSAVNDAGDIS